MTTRTVYACQACGKEWPSTEPPDEDATCQACGGEMEPVAPAFVAMADALLDVGRMFRLAGDPAAIVRALAATPDTADACQCDECDASEPHPCSFCGAEPVGIDRDPDGVSDAPTFDEVAKAWAIARTRAAVASPLPNDVDLADLERVEFLAEVNSLNTSSARTARRGPLP